MGNNIGIAILIALVALALADSLWERVKRALARLARKR